MSDWQSIDYFTDDSLVEDPYRYYDELREECPVLALPHLGVVAVTGYDELSDVYRDTESFSSCNSVVGPFAAFPVPLEGDDVSAIVAAHRDQLPMSEHMVTMDPPDHTRQRSLVMRLLTPRRLMKNEEFMWGLAGRQLDEFVADGRCEFISAYAQPFAMLVVADVLGVPEEDHQRLREGFGLTGTVGAVGAGQKGNPNHNPLGWLDGLFASYIEDRRREPRKDVLTDLALATYPDGETPDVTSVVRTSTFLFAAGQETTARLLAAALKHLAEHPELQDELRADRERIPDFLEEVLRVESPVKTDFRLTRRTTTVAGVDDHRGHAGHAAQRRRQPRPSALRVPCGVPGRPAQRPVPRRLRAGRPLLPRRPPGPGRGSRQPRTHPRPHARHPPVRGAPRPTGSPALRLRADLGPARAHQAAPRVRARRGRRVSRVAVVTGGASGIGLGAARQLAADGHRVALFDRNGSAAEAAGS